jgi:hypothetical protein
MGLRAGLAPAAVCSAMWLRHSRGTFWPNQIWHSPDHLRREQLPAGNALVEGATFVGILLGTIAGELAVRDGGAAGLFAALVMSFAIAYWMAALFIPATGEGAPHLKVASGFYSGGGPASAFRYTIMVGRDGDELVLANRHSRGGRSVRACNRRRPIHCPRPSPQCRLGAEQITVPAPLPRSMPLARHS